MIINRQVSIHIAITLLITLTSGSCYTSERVTYSGFTLFRTFPQKEQQIAGLRDLKVQDYDGIEFWTEPAGLNRTVDILVSPGQQDNFIEHIRHLRLPTKRIMYDVGEVIKRTNAPSKVGRMLLEDGDGLNVSTNYRDLQSFYNRYQDYQSIERRLEQFAKDTIVKLDVVGRSHEGRNLYLLKFSTNPDVQKPVIFLDAGHHAREWISHSTLMYIMESLINDQMPTFRRQSPGLEFHGGINDLNINDYPNESLNDNVKMQESLKKNIKSLLDRYDFWFVPVVNPDGYVHTHSHDRLWRKTRSKNGWCSGVDPNRNYPYKWGGKGTSRNTCDETFAGPKPLSEPETKVIARILSENSNRIIMYTSLHAYSQVILTPYGYDRVVPKNYGDLIRVATAGARGIYSTRGTQYKVGTAAILLYPAAGGSDDYAQELGIRYVYTIELPDTGNYGFLLPPSEIIPVGQETVSGLTSMIDAL